MAIEVKEPSVSTRILAKLGEEGLYRRALSVIEPVKKSIDEKLGGRQYKHSDVDTVLEGLWRSNPRMASDIKAATITFRNKTTQEEKLGFIQEQTDYVNRTYGAPEFANARGVYLRVLGWLQNEANNPKKVEKTELPRDRGEARGRRGGRRGRGGGGEPSIEPPLAEPPADAEPPVDSEPPREPRETRDPLRETEGYADDEDLSDQQALEMLREVVRNAGNNVKIDEQIRGGRARRLYKLFVESGLGRDYTIDMKEDVLEKARVALEKRIANKEIVSQEQQRGVDPLDSMWELIDKGKAVLRSKGIYDTSLRTVRNKGDVITEEWLNKPFGTEIEEKDRLAVIAVLGLEPALEYLTNPRREQGGLYIQTAMKDAEFSVFVDYLAGRATSDSFFVRDWIIALRNVATCWDLVVKSLHDTTMKDEKALQAAADRYLPKDEVKLLLSSKKISEAAHRAGSERPDYLKLERFDRKALVATALGKYVDVLTFKSAGKMVVSETSQVYYPEYAAWQNGRQRRERYRRIYSMADLLVDIEDASNVSYTALPVDAYLRLDQVGWNYLQRNGQINFDHVVRLAPYEDVYDLNTHTWTRMNDITGLDDNQLAAQRIVKMRVVDPWEAENLSRGRLHFDVVYDYFRYPDDGNVDKYFRLLQRSFRALDRAVSKARADGKEEVFIDAELKGLKINDKKSNEDKTAESWIGEFNLAWLLSRTGITREYFEAIDRNPSVHDRISSVYQNGTIGYNLGIDFDAFCKVRDGTTRRRELLKVWKNLMPDNLTPEERGRREKLLKRIVTLNMARTRTVWFNKESPSEFALVETDRRPIEVLQTGIDMDEVWTDSRGRIRRCFDLDMVGGSTDLTSIIQYKRYFLERETPLLEKLVANISVGNYGEAIEAYHELMKAGQFKAYQLVSELTDYFFRQTSERLMDGILATQTDLVRRQGQMEATRKMVWNFKEFLELRLNDQIHFHDAGLMGTYRKMAPEVLIPEGGAEQPLEPLPSLADAYVQEVGCSVGEAKAELLWRGLLRRAMNENFHVDAWNMWARDKFRKICTEPIPRGENEPALPPIMTMVEFNRIFEQEAPDRLRVDRNMRPLEVLLAATGLTADLNETGDDVNYGVAVVNDFTRVSGSEEIQRKDRFLKKYDLMETEAKRDERLLALCGNDPRLKAKLDRAIGRLGEDVRRADPGIFQSKLLYSLDFLDPIHWVIDDVLTPYIKSHEFIWSDNMPNKENYEKARRVWHDMPEGVPNGWVKSPGWDWCWVDQAGVKGINPHVGRWVIGSMLTGHYIPFGKYQGARLYNRYNTQELDDNGRKLETYNDRVEIGASRVRSTLGGYWTRQLPSDRSEGFPINSPFLTLIRESGYLSIHKQNVLSYGMADIVFAGELFPGDERGVYRVTREMRESKRYREILSEQLTTWQTIIVGPDCLEVALAGLSQVAMKGLDAKMVLDPQPYRNAASMFGVSSDNVAALTAYRNTKIEDGLGNFVIPSPSPEGAEVLSHAMETRKEAAKGRGALVRGIIMMTPFGGAEELSQALALDLAAEFAAGKSRGERLVKAFLGGTPSGFLLGLIPGGIVAIVNPAAGTLVVWGSAVGGLITSLVQQIDVSPEDLQFYSGLLPMKLVGGLGIPRIIRFQNRIFSIVEAIPKSPVRDFATQVFANRRYDRIMGLTGEKLPRECPRFGVAASMVDPKFPMSRLLVPEQEFLRGVPTGKGK